MKHRFRLSTKLGLVGAKQAPCGRRLAALALVCGACLLLTACSSTPEVVRLHSLLESNASMSITNDAAAGLPLRLVIAPVGIPSAVAQPQWLVRRSDDTLQMLEQDRWAAPLADEFRTALRARLASRWGIVDGALPQPVRTADEPASWRLAVEILRMDARPSVETSIDARWTLLPPGRAEALSCSHRVVESVAGAGTVAIADAYRRSVSRLADQVGLAMRGSAGSGVVAADCDRRLKSAP